MKRPTWIQIPILAAACVLAGCATSQPSKPAESTKPVTSARPAAPSPAVTGTTTGTSSQPAATSTAQPAKGLVIVKAVYGDLPAGPTATIDVTAIVAGMVKDDKLMVEATNANFTDPIVGTVKTLKVDYILNGKAGSVTADENATLTIPPAP